MQLWRALHWPALHWDTTETSWPIALARLAREHLVARTARMHPLDRAQWQLEAWTGEALATARLEGEALSVNPVRSCVARRLGIAGVMRAPREARAEHTVHLLQAALVHDGAVDTGALARWWPGTPLRARGEPPHALEQLALLLEWFNVHSRRPDIDDVACAAVTQLWFEAIRPFERGNGRIARALAERALLRDMKAPVRIVSLSAQLLDTAPDYRAQLRHAIDNDRLDVTRWVCWYARQVAAACEAAVQAMSRSAAVREAASLVVRLPGLRSSQRKAVTELLAAVALDADADTGTDDYVRMTGVSRATAWRELSMLVERGVFVRSGRGRGTRYRLAPRR